MNRFGLPCYLGGLLATALLWPAVSAAASNTPAAEMVRFETVDQVELQGTFYPGHLGNKAPSILLLHALGAWGEYVGRNRLLEGWVQSAAEEFPSFSARHHDSLQGFRHAGQLFDACQ
jgi:hypothetical protein